jgi:hypothetical protein
LDILCQLENNVIINNMPFQKVHKGFVSKEGYERGLYRIPAPPPKAAAAAAACFSAVQRATLAT